MTTLCIRIYRFFRSHRAVCWTSMLVLFGVLGWLAAQIHLEEDINKLMPSSRNEDGSIKLAFADLRIKDKTFLVFEGREGATVPQMAAACDDFVDSLLAWDAARDSSSRVIGDVFYRLPDDLMADVIDYLTAQLPAYIDTSAYAAFDTLLTREHLVRQMQVNREDFGKPVGQAFPELLQMDPLGLRNVLADRLKPLTQGATGGYKTLEGHFFVPDSTVCVAFITPMYAATNTGQGSALFERLNEQIERFAVSHPEVRVSYHGTPASGFYNASRIKADLKGTLIVSLLLVLVFISVCFRNWDTVPLLVLPVVFGTLFGLAGMYFIKGQFSLLALGIGSVVLGVAFSYVLHVITHYKYLSDPEQVLRDEVKPVCLGCLTTVGSFLGLIFVRTELLQDFGLFATLAIVGTTAFSLVYLPQMLNPAKNKLNRRAFALIDRLNAYPFDRKPALLGALSGLTVICIGFYLGRGAQFDADMHNLGYKAELTTHSEELLRSKTHTGDKQKYFAASGRTPEEALEHFAALSVQLDSLQQAGLVKAYSHTDLLLVPLRVQQQRIDAWKAYWTDERLARARRLIAETAPAAGLRPEAFSPFFDLAQADYEPDALYEAGLIPEGYLSTLMEESYDGTFLCFSSVRCANDTVRSATSDYHRICDAVATRPHQLVLDTYYYTTDTLNQLNGDFNILQWVSMLFVLLVLLASFRGNVRHTLLGFMPILLSWLIVLGLMAMFDMHFNLVNIIISTFIFGIGVDYSIFVMNGLVDGGKRPRLLEYHKTAIFFSAVILIVTVGSMLLAVHPAIRSVGFSTLTGLVAAVVLSYVMQPAVYRWLERRKSSRKD